jgi:hypothetical protein
MHVGSEAAHCSGAMSSRILGPCVEGSCVESLPASLLRGGETVKRWDLKEGS